MGKYHFTISLSDELLDWLGDRFQNSTQQIDLKWTFEQFVEEQLYILQHGYIHFSDTSCTFV